jgi:iron complex outermembrane receptor protein
MKKLYQPLLFAFTLFIFAATTVFAQQTRGTLKGKVYTSDNKPADNVSVGLRGTKYGTITNENGEYTFKAPAGTYTLTVSYVGVQSVEVPVTVTASQTVTVETTTINTSVAELKEVNISANRANRFTRKVSTDAAKIPLNNLENAQAYTTITNELLKEQQVFTADEGLRNSSGIQKLWDATGRGGDGGSYLTQRGFVTQIRVRNGVSGLVTNGIDATNLEKLEVIKGPSGTLYGSTLASFGGIVNRVTKKPFETFAAEISHSVGNFDLNRTSIDLNTPLDKNNKVLFRLNSAYTYEGSFQYSGFSRNFAAAPVLSYKVNDKLSFLAEAELFYGRASAKPFFFFFSTPNQLGIHNAKDLTIDYKQPYVDESVNQRTRSANYFVQANYKLSDKISSQTLFSSSNSFSNGASPYYYLATNAVAIGPTAPAGNDYILRYDQSTANSKFNAIQVQENINGDFNIGALRNRFVVGLDFQRQNSNQVFFGNAYGAAPINDPNFNYQGFNRQLVNSTNAANPLTSANTFPYIYKTNTYSAYASDVINLTEQLIASAGVRVDRFENKGTTNYDGTKGAEGFNQTAISPKFGLVYQAVKDQFSFFANYQNGFINQGYFTNATGSVVVADVQNANQAEGGVKMALFNGKLNGTISYYRIKVNNLLRNVVGTTINGAQVQDGTQLSKGFEAEFMANPFSGVNVVAGFSYNDSKFVDSDADVQGLRPNTAGSPYLANLYISYRIPQSFVKGLGVGFGGNYASENKVINSVSQGTFALPSYTLLNANVFLDRAKYRFGLSGNNLTNKYYYTGYTTVNPQRLRQFILSAAYKF